MIDTSAPRRFRSFCGQSSPPSLSYPHTSFDMPPPVNGLEQQSSNLISPCPCQDPNPPHPQSFKKISLQIKKKSSHFHSQLGLPQPCGVLPVFSLNSKRPSPHAQAARCNKGLGTSIVLHNSYISS